MTSDHDPAERLLREARDYFKVHRHPDGEPDYCTTCELVAEINAHLSSIESKESAARELTPKEQDRLKTMDEAHSQAIEPTKNVAHQFLEHVQKHGLLLEPQLQAEVNLNAAFRCKKCGCLWRQHGDRTWSLYDSNQHPQSCCDNSADFLSLIEQVLALPVQEPSGPTPEEVREACVKLLSLTIRLASGIEVEVNRYREHGSIIVGGKERAPNFPEETDAATRIFLMCETMLAAWPVKK